MTLEQVGVNEVMRAMAAHPEVWAGKTSELKEIAALLHGENVRQAIEMLEKLDFVVARHVPLAALSDDELFLAAARAIRFAAEGEARGGDNDTFVAAMQFMVESDRRLIASGHTKGCRSSIYSQAYEVVTALHAQGEVGRVTCDCGAVDA